MKPENPTPDDRPDCPRCGHPVPQDAPGGLCPQCVFQMASQGTDAGLPAGSKGRVEEPSLASVRSAFPELEVIERLGAGGMGVVFKARDSKLDRWVALKVLPERLAADPTFVERFQREAKLLARLNHPSIVAVHAFGQAGPYCYLLLEYVDGVNLRQAMQAGRFSPAEALGLVPRICEALQYAHDQGVLHRDIKPENILLDATGRVKIADFGIAKLVDDPRSEITLTEQGARLGTPHYMAPEQVEDPSRVDHRADIYSLGVVFYELLTGELPLGRFGAPSTRAELDQRIDAIVMRALARERELRQQSAGEVREQVENLARQPRTKEAPAEVSMTWVNWAAGLVAGSLLLPVPTLTAVGWLTSGLHAPVRLGNLEVMLMLLAALVPAAALALPGMVLAGRELPGLRRRQGAGPGSVRIAFALLAWPILLALFILMVAGTNLVIRLTGSPLLASVLGLLPVLAGSLLAVPCSWILVSGRRARECLVSAPPLVWMLQVGFLVLHFAMVSGPLFKLAALPAQLKYVRLVTSQPPMKGDAATLQGDPLRPEEVAPLPIREASAMLEVPAGRAVRLNARLWSNGVVVQGGIQDLEIAAPGPAPLQARLGWHSGADTPGTPSWRLSVAATGNQRVHLPLAVAAQPAMWTVHAIQGAIPITTNSVPADQRITLLSGLTVEAWGTCPWLVTLEAEWLPDGAAVQAAEQQRMTQELDGARENLRRIRERLAQAGLPLRSREFLAADFQVRMLEGMVSGNLQAAAQATLDHARAALALIEEEHRDGRATDAELTEARKQLETVLQHSQPPASPAPASAPAPAPAP